jgi:hypothetical protein
MINDLLAAARVHTQKREARRARARDALFQGENRFHSPQSEMVVYVLCRLEYLIAKFGSGKKALITYPQNVRGFILLNDFCYKDESTIAFSIGLKGADALYRADLLY